MVIVQDLETHPSSISVLACAPPAEA